MTPSEASSPPLKRQTPSTSATSTSSTSVISCPDLKEKQSTTRSIELARRLICELSTSAARTREGYVCIAKDDLLTITNKRRLYDVTGPLEAMGVIQTTKLFIIWTGPRLGSFSFVSSSSRNSEFVGCNALFLSQYGKRTDIPIRETGRHTSELARVYTANEPVLLPRYPKARSTKPGVATLKERLALLTKQCAELEEAVKIQEAMFNDTQHRAISVSNISRGVNRIFANTDPRLTNSDQYSLPYPTRYGFMPYTIILSAPDLKYEFLVSSSLRYPELVPEFVERRRLLVQFYSTSEIMLSGPERIASPVTSSAVQRLPIRNFTGYPIRDSSSSVPYDDSNTFDRESDYSTQNVRMELSYYTDQFSAGPNSYIDTYSDFDLFDGI